jgi:hypothetical protein
MTQTTQTSTKLDSPWKEMLEFYFEDFMIFFFPNVHTMIDWARGYEFLDNELQQVVRDAELGRRWADKLVKVWLNDDQSVILYNNFLRALSPALSHWAKECPLSLWERVRERASLSKQIGALKPIVMKWLVVGCALIIPSSN